MASILDGISTQKTTTGGTAANNKYVSPTGERAPGGTYWDYNSGMETPILRWENDNAVHVLGPQGSGAFVNGQFQSRQYSNNLTPIPSGGGGGGGGGISAAQRLADERKKLIEERKGALIGGINQRYEDEQAGFNTSEGLIRTQTDQNKQSVQTNRDFAIQKAEQQGQSAARQARQAYQDSLVQTRRRARAVGGAGTSGFLELNNMLDRELQGNLTGININVQNVVGEASNIAQDALNNLELALQKAIAGIEQDRRTSRREKDMAIKEAEFAAADQAVQVESWLADYQSKAAASGAASNARAEQQNVMQAYATDLARIKSGELNMTVDELNASYAPHFANAGVDLGAAQNYQGFLGFGGGGLSDEDKFLLDLQYKYDTLDSRNQQNDMNNVLDLYDPFSQSLNPLGQLYYPDQYNSYNNLSKLQGIQTKIQSGQALTDEEKQFVQQYQSAYGQ